MTEFGRYTATLYTIASIMDVGNQLLRQSEMAHSHGLPRTFEEYVARLYGTRPPDRFLLWNYGLLVTIAAAIIVLAVAR